MEKATIIAVGKDVKTLKKGQIIYFKNYEVDEVVDGENKYTLIQEDSVKALCTTARIKR